VQNGNVGSTGYQSKRELIKVAKRKNTDNVVRVVWMDRHSF
jgi:hypothetical protein